MGSQSRQQQAPPDREYGRAKGNAPDGELRTNAPKRTIEAEVEDLPLKTSAPVVAAGKPNQPVIAAKAVHLGQAQSGVVMARAVPLSRADDSASPTAELGTSNAFAAVPVAAGEARRHALSPQNGQQPDLHELDELEREELIESAQRRRFILSAVPSWIVSLVAHVALLLLLAAITLDPVKSVVSILQGSSATESETIEEFALTGISLDDAETLEEPMAVETPSVEQELVAPEIAAPTMDFSKEVAVDTNVQMDSIIPSSLLSSSSLAQMTSALGSRSSSGKSAMLERYGGTAATEEAVAKGLKWIAAHQALDGGWSFQHTLVCKGRCNDPGEMALARNGATAMALLPFLGAGQTHLEGQYKKQVYRGLNFLINNMQVKRSYRSPTGSWHEPGGRMYSHGLAAIAVCEAYAMTKDPDLLQPAQLSLNYLIEGQNEQVGGWRYKPGQPGDTSVVGWCLMALKSGKMGNLAIPQQTFRKADSFLDFVSTNNGAYYGYAGPTAKLNGRQATIAVGLLCRMYLGYPREHPGLKEGVQYLSERGPKLNDLYYCYYATQVMRHHGGPEWEKWNSQIRDPLVKAQETKGHAAGSWYLKGSHSKQGGRLYSTSLATMILEVYYRHLPLYSEQSSDEDFEI
ncbi:MAG: prenyltransferase/squalene oxidase repeat-containing protein [Aureliella sp.]